MSIKVSIIVPVYNVEKYVSRCLDSLVNQTLKDIEIIVINDGSTDNSAQIIEKYIQTDSRIKLISQENAGLSAARNNGIKIAKGEYIGFCDSDDWVDLDFYEKLYNTAQKYKCDIASGQIVKTKENKKRFLIKYAKEKVAQEYEDKLFLCYIPDYNYVWNKIYKLVEFKKANLEFENGMNFEDIIFSPKALYYLKSVVSVPNTNYYYFIRNNSIVTLSQNGQFKKDYNRAVESRDEFMNGLGFNPYEFKTYVHKHKILGFTICKTKKRFHSKQITICKIFKFSINKKK